MSLLNAQDSYFALGNPLVWLERRLHRYRHHQTLRINQREIKLSWTGRAETALRQRRRVLVVELQLYFSCGVKKRVLFHQLPIDFESFRVNDKIELCFRPIASAACDPNEFATRYPSGRGLSAGVAARMLPRSVEIDYRRGNWQGQFYY